MKSLVWLPQSVLCYKYAFLALCIEQLRLYTRTDDNSELCELEHELNWNPQQFSAQWVLCLCCTFLFYENVLWEVFCVSQYWVEYQLELSISLYLLVFLLRNIKSNSIFNIENFSTFFVTFLHTIITRREVKYNHKIYLLYKKQRRNPTSKLETRKSSTESFVIEISLASIIFFM